MSSSACGTSPTTWRATDGGTWWLRNSAYGEPNGDYTANNFLGLSAWYTVDTTAAALAFNDQTGGYSSSSTYLCSTNDANNGEEWLCCCGRQTRAQPWVKSGVTRLSARPNGDCALCMH